MDRAQARKKAEALVAKMTIEERAGQLKYDAPAIERLGIPTYNWWNEALHGSGTCRYCNGISTGNRLCGHV
mgnify:CR=1 FL=1